MTTMTNLDPADIDRSVGNRVRLRRKTVGLSQTELGQAIGLTFQQVQKYEQGANRISASKLYQIATVLTAPVEYFFADFAKIDAALSPPTTRL